MRVDVRDETVVVPLEVGDGALVEHAADLCEDVVAHLGARQVEHELVAAEHGRLAGDGERPVGMGAVEIRVLAHHLGLHPDAKLQAHVIDCRDELCQGSPKLLLVDPPVTEASLVVAAVGKPAVVHHQQLDTHLLRQPGELHQPVSVEVEVEGLPAVDEHGTHAVAPVATAHVLAHATMQVLRQPPEPLSRVAHDYLGCHQLLARLERIGEQLVGEPQLQARLAVLVARHLTFEASAVGELHRPAAARDLCRIAVRQQQEGILLVRRRSLCAVDHIRELAHGRAHGNALHAVAARQRDDVEVAVDEVEAGALRLFHRQTSLASVAHDGGATDHVQMREHAI